MKESFNIYVEPYQKEDIAAMKESFNIYVEPYQKEDIAALCKSHISDKYFTYLRYDPEYEYTKYKVTITIEEASTTIAEKEKFEKDIKDFPLAEYKLYMQKRDYPGDK